VRRDPGRRQRGGGVQGKEKAIVRMYVVSLLLEACLSLCYRVVLLVVSIARERRRATASDRGFRVLPGGPTSCVGILAHARFLRHGATPLFRSPSCASS
jgi:hypothetical protein